MSDYSRRFLRRMDGQRALAVQWTGNNSAEVLAVFGSGVFNPVLRAVLIPGVGFRDLDIDDWIVAAPGHRITVAGKDEFPDLYVADDWQ